MKNEQLRIEDYVKGYVKPTPMKIISEYLESLTPTIETSPQRVDYIRRELIGAVCAVVEEYRNKKVNNEISTITIARELREYRKGSKPIPTTTLAEELENLAKRIKSSDEVVYQRSLDVADALTTLSWTLASYVELEKELGA